MGYAESPTTFVGALDGQAWPVFGDPRERWVGRELSLASGRLLAGALSVSTASSELPACADVDEMLKVATQLARSSIGLERVAFYMRDPFADRLILRGSWGTGGDGEMKAEHDQFHELSMRDGLALQNLLGQGLPALCRPSAPWFASEAGQTFVIGEGWVMVTPLFAGGHLVGVMYNDAALTRAAMDPDKQAAASVLCSMVAIEYMTRRGPIRWQPLGAPAEPSLLVQRVREGIDQNPARRGNDLAHELGVSPGHLARAFKREMGISLVDYRNRKRIDRFWDSMQRDGRGGSLKQAAYEAGFGSYAQFNRVHKKFAGKSPRSVAGRNVPGSCVPGSCAAGRNVPGGMDLSHTGVGK